MTVHAPATSISGAQLGIAPHRLTPPRTHDLALGRERLLDRLDRAAGPTIIVTAGAGFGKSTMLGRWADRLACPTAWLSLDVGDNDSIRLLRGVAAALDTVIADAGLAKIARDVRPGTMERGLAALEERLRSADSFVLVLDDVHLINDPDAATLLEDVVEMIPDGSRIVLSGRSEPPVRTARMQLAGNVDSIEAAELLFTPDEAAALVEEFADRIDQPTRRLLVEQIGGWPAGVQFVVLGLRRATGAAKPDPLLTSTELLTRYFQQEFLRALPHAERQFLIRTSVLERLSGELCDHVLDHPGSAQRLDELVRSGNVFVIPSGDTGVYRYHPLFAEMLLAELRRLAPELERPLRLRAIEWHSTHGEWNAAVDQALASEGRIDAAAELFRQIVPAVSTGEVASIGRWLSNFDAAEMRANALLAVAAAWHAMFTNQSAEIERWLAVAERADVDGSLPDGTLDVATAVAAVRMLASQAGALDTLENARTVLAAGENGGPWKSVAYLQEAVALHVSGIVDEVRPLFEVAEFETRGFAAAHAVTVAHLGLDSFRRGDDVTGRRLVREAVEEIEVSGVRQLAQIAMVFAAQALAEARAGAFHASREASQHVEYLLSTLDTVQTRARIHYHLILADAALERREHATALRLLRYAQDRLSVEPDAVLLHRWVERIAERCALRDTNPRVELTAAEHRVLEQLATHRTLSEIGDHLYVSRNTVKTHTVSIYRKLLVSGRSEAVTRAVELELLDGVAATTPRLSPAAADDSR